jgi:hypothetical protein
MLCIADLSMEVEEELCGALASALASWDSWAAGEGKSSQADSPWDWISTRTFLGNNTPEVNLYFLSLSLCKEVLWPENYC